MISDRELWQRARSLFDEVVELESGPRRARLEEIGREDPILRQAVERLLMADTGAEAALRDYSFGSPRSTSPSAVNSRDPLGVIGHTVSHFRVTDYLAAGGMGAVYSAEDLQLGRTVALKFPLPHQQIDRGVKERFVNEARSAAALDHPNLCTVHEIGESEQGVFLAMPLYPGETLRDRLGRQRVLPPAEVLEIVLQMTTGLAFAHAAGIVHRDLKPGNVMLLPDGTVKVLDFGLAKIRDISLTKSHATLGTIGYVAPEQIRGDRVDGRADLWAIGVMLYEMLTGTAPFRGEHEVSTLHAVLHEEAPRVSRMNPDLPLAFDELIGALLQKDPEGRYQSAEALLSDIVALKSGATLTHRSPFWIRTARHRQVRRAMIPVAAVALVLAVSGSWFLYRQNAQADTAGPGVLRTVAVLPFVNDGGDPADNYIVSGVTDELIALLGRTPGMRLAARSSVAALQEQGLAPLEVGRQLGVAHLVRGAVRISSDTLRLAVRLTRVADDATVWSRDFAAPVSEAFALERQVADGILGVLRLQMARAPSAPLPTDDSEAYELYLKGQYAWNMGPRTLENFEQALAFYRAALVRDPRFALAYTGMAGIYVNMANFGYMPSKQAIARAEVAADRALALDSSLADAHWARGFVLSARAQFAEAEASLRQAIQLNPNSQWAHHYYAILLTMMDRLAEAKEETRRTLAIDPLSIAGNAILGIEFAAEGNLQEGRAQLRRALQLDPGFPLTLYYLGAVEAALGNDDAAREVLEQALARAPNFPGVRAALAYVYGRMGRTTEARRLLAEARSAVVDERTRLNYALALALLGPADSAFAMLRTAQWDVPTLVELRHSPLLRTFRSDPRYLQLLTGLGLRP
ncbi:serine/threonine-protein kinase [soil metagenome]